MRVLIIEDEEKLASIMSRVLMAERLDVEVAHRGDDGLELALTGVYDVLIVDRMLPGKDGLTLIRELRAAGVGTPALVLTALSELPERVKGLDAGADDYLGKPFAFEELLARLRALARRTERPMVTQALRIGAVEIDLDGRRATIGGEPVEFSHREFALLETLARNRGRVMSRDEILERVWGYDADPQGNVVELYIHYLRRKLDPPGTAGSASLIRTVRGVGYQIRGDA